MFVCNECGSTFESPKRYIEKHGLEGPPYEQIEGCPECGGDYSTATCCDICNKWIDGGYIRTSNNQIICDQCYVHYDMAGWE